MSDTSSQNTQMFGSIRRPNTQPTELSEVAKRLEVAPLRSWSRNRAQNCTFDLLARAGRLVFQTGMFA